MQASNNRTHTSCNVCYGLAMIRRAVEEDIPILLAMGQQFSAYTAVTAPYSPNHTDALLRHLLEHGAVFVSENERGVLDGGIIGMMAPIWYVEAFAAAELALWVMPDKRGAGIARELIATFEAWGKEQGATHYSMSDLCIGGAYPAGKLFESLGYRPFERSQIKEAN